MAHNDFLFEEETNFEQKWFCLFLIDVSTSMSDEALERVNEELRNLHRLINEDETSSQRVVLCIMTFGQDVKILQKPALVENITMPKVVREDGIIHAIDYAIEVINARKHWCNETGQPYYRPCLFLVTNEADEKLLHCDELKHLKEDVQLRKFDFLMVGMNGSSVHAHSSEIEIRMKDGRSLAQMLFSMWKIIKWGDYACEIPLSDGSLTGMVPPPDDTWMDAFEN